MLPVRNQSHVAKAMISSAVLAPGDKTLRPIIREPAETVRDDMTPDSAKGRRKVAGCSRMQWAGCHRIDKKRPRRPILPAGRAVRDRDQGAASPGERADLAARPGGRARAENAWSERDRRGGSIRLPQDTATAAPRLRKALQAHGIIPDPESIGDISSCWQAEPIRSRALPTRNASARSSLRPAACISPERCGMRIGLYGSCSKERVGLAGRIAGPSAPA